YPFLLSLHLPTPPHLYTLSLHDALPISFHHQKSIFLPITTTTSYTSLFNMGDLDATTRAFIVALKFAGRPATEIAALTGVTKARSEEHTSELQSLAYLVCRLLLEKKKNK